MIPFTFKALAINQFQVFSFFFLFRPAVAGFFFFVIKQYTALLVFYNNEIELLN